MFFNRTQVMPCIKLNEKRTYNLKNPMNEHESDPDPSRPLAVAKSTSSSSQTEFIYKVCLSQEIRASKIEATVGVIT